MGRAGDWHVICSVIDRGFRGARSVGRRGSGRCRGGVCPPAMPRAAAGRLGRRTLGLPVIQRRYTIRLKFCAGALVGVGLLAVAATSSWATPSSIIFIPSTDVQAPNTNHLGLDSYFSY